MEAFIFDAVRTPRGRGKSNGSLHTLSPLELAATVLRALRERNGFEPAELEDIAFGCSSTVDDQGANLARSAAIEAGYGDSAPGFMVGRFCGSGLDAFNAVTAKVMSGQGDLFISGGIEMNSLIQMLIGAGGPSVSDVYFNDKVMQTPQGVAADLVATLKGYTREDVDRYAMESHRRAARAQEGGWYSRSVVPVEDRNGVVMLERDELVRGDTTLDSLGKLKPSFQETGEKLGFDQTVRYRYPQVDRINHVHHAGNSSGISDGASALLVGSKAAGERLGLKPRARILATATSAADPCIMLTAPVPASRKCAQRAGLTLKNIDIVECNEAFASVPLYFMDETGIPHDKVNVVGGAIALGHPVGATGGILIGTALDELERRGEEHALITMCTGLGMGVATLIQRV